MTGIQWTQEVWNPATGCDKVSPGCGLPRFDGDGTGGCYAMAMAMRLKAMGQAKYQKDGDPRTSGPGFGVTVHHDALKLPMRWREPRKVFVNSMSDLFHEDVPDEFIARVFAVMAATPQHTYQLLTKRHARMRSLLSRGELGTDGFPDMVEEAMAEFTHASLDQWPLPNVHLGVSAEDQHWADIRVPALLRTPAAVRFVSAEPLLGPVHLRPGEWMPPVGGGPKTCLSRPWETPGPSLDWVIIGGESGPGARLMTEGWARSLVKQCQDTGTPVFVKQLGSVLGRELGAGPKGGDWDAWPESLRVREFPRAHGAVTA